MPERDLFHDVVKTALQKDGWTITHDPLYLRLGIIQMFIDLGAEKVIAAEKAGRKIAVEIKGFTSLSLVNEFHTALGQFINYREALNEEQPERVLYLAVPEDIYATFFALSFVHDVIQRYDVKLIAYNVQKEEIMRWTE
jgi:hypothetical protein